MIDLMDDTFLVVDPAQLARRLHDRALWKAWWPELRLSVTADRGERGLRWAVDGRLIGTSEVWLEPHRDGVILHYYLRVDPAGRRWSGAGPRRDRRARRLARRHTIRFKRAVWQLKDEVEAGRPPGRPRRPGVIG